MAFFERNTSAARVNFRFILIGLIGFFGVPKFCAAKITPIRLGIMPEYQIFGAYDLVGLEAGLLIAGSTAPRRSVGIIVSPGISTANELVGVSVGLLSGGNNLWGVSLGCLTGDYRRGAGIQAGFWNGVSFGLSSAPREENKFMGLRLGAVNNRSRGPTWGADIGLFNFEEEMAGLQIGVFNWAKKLHGVQIGIWNRSGTENGTRNLPLINVAF